MTLTLPRPPKDQLTLDYFDQHMPEYSLARFDYAIGFLQRTARPDSTLIDVGCGTGNILEYVRRATPLRETWGVDVAPNYVAKTKARVGGEVLLGSVLDDDFMGGIPQRFDFVLLGAALHHLISPTRRASRRNAAHALKNALSLAKPGGHLIIIEPTFAPKFSMDMVFWAKRLATQFTSGRIRFGDHWNNLGAPVVSYYTNAELAAMVEESGLGHIAYEDIKDLIINRLWRLAGIWRRTDTTLIIQRHR